MARLLNLRVAAIEQAAESIKTFDIRAPDGGALPAFTPGAHIDVQLPQAMRRSYSLLNGPGQHDRYLIGVALDAAGAGGSSYLHEQIAVGDALKVSLPRNRFALAGNARHHLFIAGGIGITPVLSMVRHLAGSGQSWKLHYAARSRKAAAFVDELAAHGEHVSIRFDDEAGGGFIDVAAIVRAAPGLSDLYCCGPRGMLESFIDATDALPSDHVHLESFVSAQPSTENHAFTVELARSRRVFEIPVDATILEVLLAAGVDAPYSCRLGICSQCRTEVVSGVPDHRDAVLSPAERASGKTMMVCCSRALSERLVLDR
jgi:ferredoxin-NADP reductase